MLLPTTATTAYANNYRTWLRSLLSEIDFWRRYMQTKGLSWSASFEEKISPTKRFEFDDFISNKSFGGGGDWLTLVAARSR